MCRCQNVLLMMTAEIGHKQKRANPFKERETLGDESWISALKPSPKKALHLQAKRLPCAETKVNKSNET